MMAPPEGGAAVPDRALSAPLARGLLTRRTALVGMALTVAGGVLAGCTGSRRRAAEPGSGQAVVDWSNWPDYIDVGADGLSHPTLDDFRRATGITVRYTEDYYSNEEFFKQVAPQLAARQDPGRDTWCSTDYLVARLIRLGYLQRLDHARMPHTASLEPSLRDVQYDRGRHYSMPWQSGFTGIGFNPQVSGGRVESVTQLLTDPALHGKVALLSDMQDTVGLTMLDMGIDPSSFRDADFDRVIARLAQVKASGQIKAFTGNEYTGMLASGRIAACLAYTGDIVQLQSQQPSLGYTLPTRGHLLWSDNFVIPNAAQHKEQAERLIDFYYRPPVMARVESYVNYISPVRGSRQALLSTDPKTANDPLIFPPKAVLARAHVFRAMTAEQDGRYNRAFQRLVNS
jgi:spermidine/putrescine transport system substrate-binding protein